MGEASIPAKKRQSDGALKYMTAFLGWLCLVFSGMASALDVGDITVQPVEDEIRYIEGDGSSSIEDMLRISPERWRDVGGVVNFGYTSQPYWFRFSLNNPSEESLARLIVIAYALLDYIDVYQTVDGEVIQAYRTGDEFPFAQRPFNHRYFIFPVDLSAKQNSEVFIRIKTSGALQLPVEIWKEREFFGEDSKVVMFNAFYMGTLLVMAAFILVLYFALHDRSFLYYVFLVLSVLMLIACMHGFVYQFVMPNSPNLHSRVILLMVPLSQLVVCAFTVAFLGLREQQRYWFRLFVILMVVECCCLVGAFVLPYSMSIRISIAMTIPVVLTSFIAGFRFWRFGDRSARLFTVAWGTFLAGVSITLINRLGFLPISFVSEYGIPVSTASQSILFALALASRFTEERFARLKAQERMVEALNKQRNTEKQLIHSVSHNEVTGLPNRILFERSLQPFIDQPPTGCECISVIMLHLRRFDDVNKTLGHRNADVLLGQVGQRISNVLNDSEDSIPLEKGEYGVSFAAHIEGVSFAFALAKPDRNETIKALEPLIREISTPIEFMKLQLELSFIVGCSFADDERDPQTLLRQAFIAFDTADIRMSPIAIYSADMNPYSPRRLTLMTELRAALENDRLELFFQPQIHLGNKWVCGFEALLRWYHDEYGMVPPDEFIPMAEKTGLMRPLTRWVIEKAVDFCRDLDALGCPANVAVNISALNLREENFCAEVCEILQKAGVSPDRLVLEVTETAAMIDPASSVTVLQQLQLASIKVAIDDFGTGHSSLSYIRKLPVQEIKIDRSFVMEMDSNKGDETIVRTTVNMCHDLGYQVVAEGVENEPILNLLERLQCDVIQGYFIARPMSRGDMLEWLKTTHWRLSPQDQQSLDLQNEEDSGARQA